VKKEEPNQYNTTASSRDEENDVEDAKKHKLYSHAHLFVPHVKFLSIESLKSHKLFSDQKIREKENKEKDKKNDDEKSSSRMHLSQKKVEDGKKKESKLKPLIFRNHKPVRKFFALSFFKLKRRSLEIDSNTVFNVLKIGRKCGGQKVNPDVHEKLFFIEKCDRKAFIQSKKNLKTFYENKQHWEKKAMGSLLKNYDYLKKSRSLKNEKTHCAFRIQTNGYKVKLYTCKPRSKGNEKNKKKKSRKRKSGSKQKKGKASRKKRKTNANSAIDEDHKEHNLERVDIWREKGPKGFGYGVYSTKEHEFDEKERATNKVLEHGKYFVGVDPGHSTMISVCGKFCKDAKDKMCEKAYTHCKECSKKPRKLSKTERNQKRLKMGMSEYSLENRQWRELNFSHQSSKIIEKKKLNQTFLDTKRMEDRLNEGNPLTTYEWVKEYLKHSQKLYDQAMNHILACLGLRREIRTRRSYKEIAKGIQNSVSEVVGTRRKQLKGRIALVWGSGGFGPTSRGWASAPNKKLRNGLKKFFPIILSTEHRTSRVCSKCHGKEDLKPGKGFPVKKKKMKRNELKEMETEGVKKKEEMRGLRHCPGCKTTWNRDTNAALNILFLFQHRLLHPSEVRLPTPFSRRVDSLFQVPSESMPS